MIYLLYNFAVLAISFYFRQKIKTSHQWFNRSLFSAPLWVTAVLSAGGFLINWTPFMLEMLVPAVLFYWVDEGIYQSTGYSPIANSVKRVTRLFGISKSNADAAEGES